MFRFQYFCKKIDSQYILGNEKEYLARPIPTIFLEDKEMDNINDDIVQIDQVVKEGIIPKVI